MNTSTLDTQINSFTFWAAMACFATGVLSLFFPLHAPDGPLADRIAWFSANSGPFIAGWVVQIGAMLALSAVFAGAAWQIADNHPLRALLSVAVVLMSTMAFIIPKFIAVWSIPLMAEAAASGATGHATGAALIDLLDPVIPFTLFTSFDFLGFWLYAVAGLILAGPLFRLSRSLKAAALGLVIYGLWTHAVLIGVLTGIIPLGEINAYSAPILYTLFLTIVGMAFHSWRAMSTKA
jgi:hypothetical protein